MLPGVYHTLEIPFVFETPVATACVFSPTEVLLSLEMSRAWTTFARGAAEPATGWPPYGRSGEANIRILRTVEQGGSTTESRYNYAQCQFWRDFYV